MNATILGIDSRVAFTGLVALVAVQRLCELAISNRHLVRLRARGGFEVGADHYPWMVALHVAFLFSCVFEVWLFERTFFPALAVVSVLVLVAAQGLRVWTLRTLGDRWTTRVMVVPGEELIPDGPYRWIRHPNYLVVVIEIAVLPLVHAAWLTAVVFTILNLAMLRLRVGVEEEALRRYAGRHAVITDQKSGGLAG